MLELLDSIYEEVVMAIALGTGAAVVTYFKKVQKSSATNKINHTTLQNKLCEHILCNNNRHIKNS